jgi:hypothetical protein
MRTNFGTYEESTNQEPMKAGKKNGGRGRLLAKAFAAADDGEFRFIGL